jgi:hypothetical protein
MNRIQVATTGLFAAWLVHDIEELATMTNNSRVLLTRLPGWLPVPASVRAHGFTNRYVATAIPAVGLVVAAAAVRGYRTQGHSALYQNALLGFGLHGLGHIGMSAVTGRYVSGAATSPVIVLPFWLWATRALNQGGVPNRRTVPAAVALAAGSIAVGHLVASVLTRNRIETTAGQAAGTPRGCRAPADAKPVPEGAMSIVDRDL